MSVPPILKRGWAGKKGQQQQKNIIATKKGMKKSEFYTHI
jgi:hypothetical protein